MKRLLSIQLAILVLYAGIYGQTGDFSIILPSKNLSASSGKRNLTIGGLFYETASGRAILPSTLAAKAAKSGRLAADVKMPDGRTISLSITPAGNNFEISLSADRTEGIRRWGLTIDSAPDEYYTGLMERVVDGPQQASWAPGIKEAMDLRGQKVDMILKPTTSVYAPFYLSSRGYATFAKTDWPGKYDF